MQIIYHYPKLPTWIFDKIYTTFRTIPGIIIIKLLEQDARKLYIFFFESHWGNVNPTAPQSGNDAFASTIDFTSISGLAIHGLIRMPPFA